MLDFYKPLYEPRGGGFKSCHAHQNKQWLSLHGLGRFALVIELGERLGEQLVFAQTIQVDQEVHWAPIECRVMHLVEHFNDEPGGDATASLFDAVGMPGSAHGICQHLVEQVNGLAPGALFTSMFTDGPFTPASITKPGGDDQVERLNGIDQVDSRSAVLRFARPTGLTDQSGVPGQQRPTYRFSRLLPNYAASTTLGKLSKPIWLTTGLPHPALSRRERVPPPSPAGGRAGNEGLRRQLNEGKMSYATLLSSVWRWGPPPRLAARVLSEPSFQEPPRRTRSGGF